MAVDLDALITDLVAESADLHRVLGDLGPADWDRDTPAVGWTIRDQVTHLAFFDEAAVASATDPDGFRARADSPALRAEDHPDRVAERFAGLPGAEALAWLERARRSYVEVFAALDPGVRLPWYGPPMSPASSVTARLMETWAHGQDVLDALGLSRRPTDRLRHVAHLGVRTMGWSFRTHGRPVPGEPIRVELAAPDGGTWSWGPDDAADRVTGTAEDFCLLVTQRRHRSGTGLRAEGPHADAWLDVAQAFAGAPGPGRPPVA
ncbi:TIGR03084 family metal-binding protein [Blastococcus sp. SYSU DS0539]